MNISGVRTHIFIGDLEILRAPVCIVRLERFGCVSTAFITLPDPKGELFKIITEDDPVEIRFGYRSEEPAIWKGTIGHTRPNGNDELDVYVNGPGLPLATTKIVQSWRQEPTESIIRYAIERSGLTVGKIESPGPVFPHFAASNHSPYEIARLLEETCQRAFSIDMRDWALWVGADGLVNWGDFDEAGDVPVIATGENLIEHLPDPDSPFMSKITTFLLPGFSHSRLFRIKDVKRGIDKEALALSVRHEIKPGSVRTIIRYGDGK